MNGLYQSTLKTITTGVRPASVVTFIDSKSKNWHECCIRIIEWYSQMWGGAHNIIVPTDGTNIHETFWFLLERFSPDYIFHYREYEYAFDLSKDLYAQILKRLNPFHYHSGCSSPMVTAGEIDDVGWPLTALLDLIPHSKNLEPQEIVEMKLQVPVLVQLYAYATIGKTTENYRRRLEETGFEVGVESYDDTNTFSELFGFAWGCQGSNNPFALSMHNLTLCHPRGARRKWEDPLVLVCGGSVEDFCLYFCLSKMRDEVYWLPPEAFQDDCLLLSKVAERLGYDMDFHRNSRNIKSVLMISMKMSHEQLEEIKPTLVAHINEPDIEDKLVFPDSIEQLLPYVWRPFEKNNYSNSYREQFVNGESVNFINTPRPKNFDIVDPEKHRWITELQIEKYQLPVKVCLGTLSVGHNIYTTSDVRVATHGISYFCPNPLVLGGQDIDMTLPPLKLHLLEPFELFSTLFEDTGLHIRYSDKGDYQREATAKIGSLEALADICKQEYYRNLFDLYLDGAKSKSGDYTKGVILNSRRYLNLAAIKNVVGELAPDTLNVLLEKGVLHRGFVFKCERCRNADWYSISEVTDMFQCHRCAARQSYLSGQLRLQRDEQRVEPEWFYKLDELFYQGWEHDMYVPILTLARLQKDAKSSFLYVPEIEYGGEPDFEKSHLEIDICAVQDGEIILGEAKKGDRLAEKDEKGDLNSNEKTRIKKYAWIARRLGAKRLIFSTFQENWSDAMMDNVHELLGGSEIRPEFLTKSELLEESE